MHPSLVRYVHICRLDRMRAALLLALLLAAVPALGQTGAQLATFSVKPNSLTGGETSTGTITLTQAAPAGGAVVRLVSNDTAASVPSTVTVAAGQTTATFTPSSTAVTARRSVYLTATYGQGVRSACLTLREAGANPRVPAGGGASFRDSGSEGPASGLTWDVLRGSTSAGTNSLPNGWSVSYTASTRVFEVSAPASAVVAVGYKARTNTGGANRSALFDVVAAPAAPPAPLPAWAEDVRPTDSCPAGGAGPSSADSVDLATGVYENRPGSDLSASNPVGPSVSYTRMYRSARAQEGYRSPGLSAGWTDNYDVTLKAAAPGTWGGLTLTYPNGATESLTPVLSGGKPTGKLTAPTGAPYFCSGLASSVTGRWQWVRVTFGDLSAWTFTPSAGDPNTYLLTRITNLVGRYVSINYDAAHSNRLTSVVNDEGLRLLSFAYSGSYLSSVSDCYGRTVRYTFAPTAGLTCLHTVSLVSGSGTLWRYGYTAIDGHPFLTSVSAPNAAQAATGIIGHPVSYDAGTGRVRWTVDANGNTRSCEYQPGKTLVTVKDRSGRVAASWTQVISAGTRDAGTVDARGGRTTLEYADPRHPNMVTRATNELGQSCSWTYDDAGNVLTSTSPRGVITRYTYDYSLSPLGLLTSVQEGIKTSTLFAYYPNGLLRAVATPKPGTTSATSSNERVWTEYTYTGLGSLATVTGPAPSSTPGVTLIVRYSYTLDPDRMIRYARERLGKPLVVEIVDASGQRVAGTPHVHFSYDAAGNTSSVVNGLGAETLYRFNSARQVTDVLYPATGQTGNVRARTRYSYLYPGGPLAQVDLLDESAIRVRTARPAYGTEGELAATSVGSIRRAAFLRDGLYRTAQRADGNGHGVRSRFDEVGNQTGSAYPLSDGLRDALQWTHDAAGNAAARLDGNGQRTRYQRAAEDGLLTGVSYADGSGSQFEYDVYGRLSRAENATGSVEWAHDDLDNVLSVTATYTAPDGTSLAPQTVSYTYYPDGSRASMVTPAGTFSYSYDLAGQMTDVYCPWTGGHFTYQYDAAGRMTKQHCSKADTTFECNARGQLSALKNTSTGTGTPALSWFTNLQYDAAGNRTGMSVTIPAVGYAAARTGSVSYQYDGNDRMRRETRWVGGAVYYDSPITPDPADNLTYDRFVGFSYNADDQATGSGYAYDGNGAATTHTAFHPLYATDPANGALSYSLTYDPEGRPASVGGITQAWRADGARAWRQVSGQRTYFLYDGDLVLCQLDVQPGNTLLLTFAYGYGPNGLVQRYYASNPSVGYKVYTFDPDGNPVQRIRRYDTSPADTMVYDAGGLMWQDVSANSGGPYPELDPVGAGGQWGAFTDEQTRLQPVYGAQFSTGLPLSGSEYIDPSTGRPLVRDQWDEYKAAELPYQVFSGIGKGFVNEAWKSLIGGSSERIFAGMGVSPAKLKSPRARAILERVDNPFTPGDSAGERAGSAFGGFSFHAGAAFFAATGMVRGGGGGSGGGSGAERPTSLQKGVAGEEAAEAWATENGYVILGRRVRVNVYVPKLGVTKGRYLDRLVGRQSSEGVWETLNIEAKNGRFAKYQYPQPEVDEALAKHGGTLTGRNAAEAIEKLRTPDLPPTPTIVFRPH